MSCKIQECSRKPFKGEIDRAEKRGERKNRIRDKQEEQPAIDCRIENIGKLDTQDSQETNSHSGLEKLFAKVPTAW